MGSTIADTAGYLMKAPAADTAVLNPAYRYLRVTSGQNVALLVLGYVDADPKPGTEVWYSGDKETLRLWQGRIAGTGGLAIDWRSVRFIDTPAWRIALGGEARYQRVRDVMPGYVADARDDVRIVPIAPPQKSQLKGLAADTLQWFEERTTPQGLIGGLPPARFAVDFATSPERVVYSEQCLSVSLCITTQLWPAAPARTASAS